MRDQAGSAVRVRRDGLNVTKEKYGQFYISLLYMKIWYICAEYKAQFSLYGCFRRERWYVRRNEQLSKYPTVLSYLLTNLSLTLVLVETEGHQTSLQVS